MSDWQLPRDLARIVSGFCGEAKVSQYTFGGWCVSIGPRGSDYGRQVLFAGTKRECEAWARAYRAAFKARFKGAKR